MMIRKVLVETAENMVQVIVSNSSLISYYYLRQEAVFLSALVCVCVFVCQQGNLKISDVLIRKFLELMDTAQGQID